MTADERKRSARFKRPLKRLVSCGTCKACTRAECGNCINCLDKLKFGGQGIRKQCCINRRCLKLKQHVTPLQPQNQDDDKTQDLEQQLFWTAVAGCMKLTGEAYDVSEHSSPAAERKSDDATDDKAKDGKLERPSKGLPLSGDESTFCFKLASLLASDGTLASKPIAVRLMSSPQLQSQQSGSLELPRLSLLHSTSTSSGGMHDLNALRASLSLGVS